jgi:hypothetical protein
LDLVDVIKELSERTVSYQSQKKIKGGEMTSNPTFDAIRHIRNEVQFMAVLNTLTLSLGDKGKEFITFKMADTNVQLAMVCFSNACN